MFSHAFRFTQAKEVMLVMNRLPMAKEFGRARLLPPSVSSRIDMQQ